MKGGAEGYGGKCGDRYGMRPLRTGVRGLELLVYGKESFGPPPALCM